MTQQFQVPECYWNWESDMPVNCHSSDVITVNASWAWWGRV